MSEFQVPESLATMPRFPPLSSQRSEMSQRMQALDWSRSPLGPPQRWPQSLRSIVALMLDSRFPMFLAWGPELRFFYNDAYIDILGAKHPSALGERFAGVWFEIWRDLSPLVDAALAGEASYREDLPLLMNRRGFAESAWFTFSYSPARDDSGRVAGLFCACTETTLKVSAERRHTFRLGLEERLQTLNDSRAIMDAAVELLARHLGASRAGYSEVQADAETIVCHSCFADGVAPLLGTFKLSDFGQVHVQRQRDGATEVIDDVSVDPEIVRHTWAAIEARALVSVPLIRDGQLKASLYVNHRQPHHWSREEVLLIEEVAARTWSAVERAVAKASERDSAQRLQLALEAGRLAEVTFGMEDGSVRHSDRFDELLGHPPKRRLTLAEIRAQYHPDDQARILAERQQILESRQGFYEVEHRVVCPDGEVRWIHGRGQVERDAAGKALSVTVVYLDATERKDNELALRQLNDRLEQQVAERTAELRANQARVRAAFETSYTFQGLMATDGTLLDANQTSLSSIERRREEVLGLPLWDTPWFSATPGMADAVREAVARVAVGATFRQEVHVHLPTGWRWFDFSMRPIRDDKGKVVAIVPEAVETTERRLAVEALLQSQKLEAMGQLTGGVAHDFNNLLTPIMGGLDMLQRAELSPDRQKRIINSAMQAAERARVLVQRLLAFARRQPLQPVAVDVARVVEGMAELISRTSGPQVKVSVELAGDLPAAKADPNQLEMALLNLAVNARDAMPDGGLLRISAVREEVGVGHYSQLEPGVYICLSVADSGVGMDEVTLARAIEPFFSTKGVGRGTGLGLSMAHGLTVQLGGTLTLRSSPGLGTNVELWLPVTKAAADPARAEEPAAGAAESAGLVLLVDDEELVRGSAADMLTDLGYTVIEAQSGEHALKLLEAGLSPDILVTDHLMPGMSGTELIRTARSRWPGLQALLVSGYADVEGVAAELPRLTKPFRSAELAASLLATGISRAG
ncbi:MAG TPA: PAS domain-containing protein [Pseudoxanthomonas sp.]|nr:PAS domain-containing protein [Pseudoxanthomonas sp.]